MLAIRSKADSDKSIRVLNLNRISEEVFAKGEASKVRDFLSRTNCRYYNIRDKKNPGGEFLYKLTPHEIMDKIGQYEEFSIYESLESVDKNNMLLQGEVEISSDWGVVCSLSTKRGIPNRVAMQSPEFVSRFSLLDSKEPEIVGLSYMLDFIISKSLFDVVVEFTLYDTLVGVNKEHYIVWELRNY